MFAFKIRKQYLVGINSLGIPVLQKVDAIMRIFVLALFFTFAFVCLADRYKLVLILTVLKWKITSICTSFAFFSSDIGWYRWGSWRCEEKTLVGAPWRFWWWWYLIFPYINFINIFLCIYHSMFKALFQICLQIVDVMSWCDDLMF